MTNLDAPLTRLNKRRRHFRVGFGSFITIHLSLITLILVTLTLSLSRAEEHYAKMAKVNQESAQWTR